MQITITGITHYLFARDRHNTASMKYYILLGLFAVAAAFPGVIHDHEPVQEKFDHELVGESEHQHHVQHEHAKSHQSIKFEHFHPVPVYVKKEHSHLLKHPLEKGKSGQELKQIHPEHQHHHGGGLVLEDHRENSEHFAGLHHGGFEEGGFEHGGYEGGEGLSGYSGGEAEHHQPLFEAAEGGHYQFAPEHGHGLAEEGAGYHFDSY